MEAGRREATDMTSADQLASVRYICQDVDAAVAFYAEHLGFEVGFHPAPAFAEVLRGPLRLLLSGPGSSGYRATPAEDFPPGRNRIHLVVGDLEAELARLRAAGVTLVSDIVSGPGGRQFVVADPDGNLVEIFQPGDAD